MNNYNEKHKQKADELKAIGRYGNLRGNMIAHCTPELWEMALEYAKRTGDVNGMDVILKGA